MAINEKRYLMKLPKVTPEQYARDCYIDLANWTSSPEAIANLNLSETVQLPTVTIKHRFWVDADYTAQIGREEIDKTVVQETHKFNDGTSYTEEVTKEETRVEWDPHENKLSNESFEYLIPLKDIDMSALGVESSKKVKPYWLEQGWTELELGLGADGWKPATDEIIEKLKEVPFDAETFQQQTIEQYLDSSIKRRLPLGYKYWKDLEYKANVVSATTTIGLRIDYRVKCEYKGQTFHIPRIGKETIPLPTQGNVRKDFKSKASTFNYTARKEWLCKNHPDYHKNRKLKEKMLLLMPAAGLLGVVLTMVASNIVFLFVGAAGAVGAWFMYKRTNEDLSKIEMEAAEQANQEYQKLKAEEENEIAEHNSCFEDLKKKKIDALNALFAKKGMPPLNEDEIAQFK